MREGKVYALKESWNHCWSIRMFTGFKICNLKLFSGNLEENVGSARWSHSIRLELSAWWFSENYAVLYFKLCQLCLRGRDSRAQPYQINSLVADYGYQSQSTTNLFFRISCCVSSLEWKSKNSFISCNLKSKDRIKLKNLVESNGSWVFMFKHAALAEFYWKRRNL